jgi:polysaccharide export outer membrane protein
LGADDEIAITVHGHPDLNSDLTITRGGFITAPLVGDVEAVGLTRRQLALRLAELLGRDYLVDPQVDVDVESFQSQWVMVAGEVRGPGRVALKGGTRLKEVLAEAGGFADTSGEVITVTRKANGAEAAASVDIDRWDYESGNLNPVLQDGDIVSVAKAKYAYLQGEVGSPGRIRIERGMTLLRALSQGGGLTDWANKKKIEIIAAEGGQPQSYNLKDIQKGRSADPTLFGGEIIVVKRRFF